MLSLHHFDMVDLLKALFAFDCQDLARILLVGLQLISWHLTFAISASDLSFGAKKQMVLQVFLKELLRARTLVWALNFARLAN